MTAGGVPTALAWSGGKDSMLALARARERGLRVTHLLNLYEGSTGLVRFHGVPAAWIGRQADGLGLELVQRAVEEDGFAPAFLGALDRLKDAGVEVAAFGNIHLRDVSDWYRLHTTGAGLRHEEPLWGEDPAALVREFLERGYRTVITSVNLELGDPAWLGRVLDEDLLSELEGHDGLDPAGERGEYHSFVFDGPGFERPLEPRFAGERELEGHRFLEFEQEASTRVVATADRPPGLTSADGAPR